MRTGQAPHFPTNSSSGCRKVSMGMKPNKELLPGATGVTSHPGGPHPAGMFGFVFVFLNYSQQQTELNSTALVVFSSHVSRSMD